MKKTMRSAFTLSFLFIQFISFSQATPAFRATVTGTGRQTAILLPGFTCSGEVWNATAAELSKNYTCHVLIFAGFAGTSAQADPHLRDWVAGIAAYIRDKHLDRSVIIGHSIGGGLALWLAADYPQLVSKIVVVDALPCLGAAQNPAFVAQPNADCSPFVNRYTAMSDSVLYAMQKRTIPMLCADTTVQPAIVKWSMQSDRKTMGQIYCEFYNTDLRDTIARIQCNALVLQEAPFAPDDAVMQQQYSKLKNK